MIPPFVPTVPSQNLLIKFALQLRQRQSGFALRTHEAMIHLWLAKGYGSFATAWRTLQGIEAVNMIRKGRARWVAKGDTIAQAAFIAALFGIAA